MPNLLQWAGSKVKDIKDLAFELMHPRGPDGRFIKKWGVSKAKADKVASHIATAKVRTFPSDAAAGQYAFNAHHAAISGKGKGAWDQGRFVREFGDVNDRIRAGKPDEVTDSYAQMMDRNTTTLDQDLIVTRMVNPEALGLGPDAFTPKPLPESPDRMVTDVENLTGTTIADAGYTSGGIGTEYNNPAGKNKIRMVMLTPAGTKVSFPGSTPTDRQVVYQREQPFLITNVDRDGQGGHIVYAMAMDAVPGERTQPLDVTAGERKLAKLNAPRDKTLTSDQMTTNLDRAKGEPLKRLAQQAGVSDTGTDEEIRARIRQAAAAPGRPSGVVEPAAQAPAAAVPDNNVPGNVPAGPGAPAPRQEQLQSEGMGGGAPAAPAAPGGAAPETPGGGAPETPQMGAGHFRRLVQERDLPRPSSGKRRQEWNNAYNGIATGRKQPADMLRELETDIAVNRRRGDVDGTDTELDRDIEAQEALADAIAESFDLPRGARPESGTSREADLPELTDAQREDLNAGRAVRSERVNIPAPEEPRGARRPTSRERAEQRAQLRETVAGERGKRGVTEEQALSEDELIRRGEERRRNIKETGETFKEIQERRRRERGAEPVPAVTPEPEPEKPTPTPDEEAAKADRARKAEIRRETRSRPKPPETEQQKVNRERVQRLADTTNARIAEENAAADKAMHDTADPWLERAGVTWDDLGTEPSLQRTVVMLTADQLNNKKVSKKKAADRLREIAGDPDSPLARIADEVAKPAPRKTSGIPKPKAEVQEPKTPSPEIAKSRATQRQRFDRSAEIANRPRPTDPKELEEWRQENIGVANAIAAVVEAENAAPKSERGREQYVRNHGHLNGVPKEIVDRILAGKGHGTKYKISQVTPSAGETTQLDRKTMRPVGSIPDGNQVEVLHAGYELDFDGEKLLARRAEVIDAGRQVDVPETAVPKPDAKPKRLLVRELDALSAEEVVEAARQGRISPRTAVRHLRARGNKESTDASNELVGIVTPTKAETVARIRKAQKRNALTPTQQRALDQVTQRSESLRQESSFLPGFVNEVDIPASRSVLKALVDKGLLEMSEVAGPRRNSVGREYRPAGLPPAIGALDEPEPDAKPNVPETSVPTPDAKTLKTQEGRNRYLADLIDEELALDNPSLDQSPLPGVATPRQILANLARQYRDSGDKKDRTNNYEDGFRLVHDHMAIRYGSDDNGVLDTFDRIRKRYEANVPLKQSNSSKFMDPGRRRTDTGPLPDTGVRVTTAQIPERIRVDMSPQAREVSDYIHSFEAPPTREDAEARLLTLTAKEIQDIAKEFSLPGWRKMRKAELAKELANRTAGRRRDSIAIRGFTGRSPSSEDGPPIPGVDLSDRARGQGGWGGTPQEQAEAIVARFGRSDGQGRVDYIDNLNLSQEELSRAASVAGLRVAPDASRDDLIKAWRDWTPEAEQPAPSKVLAESAKRPDLRLNPGRAASYEDALADEFMRSGKNNFGAPEGSPADLSLGEINRGVVSGGLTPNQALEMLENDIELNQQDIIELERDARANPGLAQALRAERAQKMEEIRAEERASKFLRKHFEGEPDITPAEVAEEASVLEQIAEIQDLGGKFRDASPADMEEMRKGFKQVGLENIEGTSGEELFGNALRELIRREVESRGMKPEKAPKPKPVKATPPAPGKGYEVPNARAIAEGLDESLIGEKLMADVQRDLANPKNTPASVGRMVDKMADATASTQAVKSAINPELTDEIGHLQAIVDERRKLAARLKATRRKRATAPKPEEPTLTPDEDTNLAEAARLTGIPEADLKTQAVDKKLEAAPASEHAKGVVDLLKVATSPEEGDKILGSRTKAELLDIGKAAGLELTMRESKKSMVDKINRRLVRGRLEHEAYVGLGDRPPTAPEAPAERGKLNAPDTSDPQVKQRLQAVEAAEGAPAGVPMSRGGHGTAGRTNLGRIQPGEKFLAEQNDKGEWRFTDRVTTGTPLEFVRREQIRVKGYKAGRNIVIARDPDGNEVRIGGQTGFPGIQTVKLAPEPKAPKKAKGDSTPEISPMQQQLNLTQGAGREAFEARHRQSLIEAATPKAPRVKQARPTRDAGLDQRIIDVAYEIDNSPDINGVYEALADPNLTASDLGLILAKLGDKPGAANKTSRRRRIADLMGRRIENRGKVTPQERAIADQLDQVADLLPEGPDQMSARRAVRDIRNGDLSPQSANTRLMEETAGRVGVPILAPARPIKAESARARAWANEQGIKGSSDGAIIGPDGVRVQGWDLFYERHKAKIDRWEQDRLKARESAMPVRHFDADSTARAITRDNLETPDIVQLLEGLNATQLRQTARAIGLPIPAKQKDGSTWGRDALRQYIGENVRRDRTRWSLGGDPNLSPKERAGIERRKAEAAARAATEGPTNAEIMRMNISDLRQLAKNRGIANWETLGKDALLDALLPPE